MTPAPPPNDALEAANQRIAQLEEQVFVLNQIMDIIPEMLLYKGPASRIRWANRAFRDHYGMSMEQLQDLIDAPFNEPDYTQQYILDDRQVFTSGETLDIPVEPVTRHDGQVFQFHTVKTPVRDERGAVIGTVGISRNISHEQATEAALLASEARLKRIIANVPGLVYQYLVRPDGTSVFPFVSDGSRDIYGLEPEAIRADSELILKIVVPQDRPGFEASIERSAATMEPWYWEGRVNINGQIKYLQGAAQPTREPDGSLLWDGLLMDISEHKRAEGEQARLQEEIIRLQATALAELSTPLIPLSNHSVIMPLVGSIDSQRAQQVIETLLQGVATLRARVAILDVTGVPVVDTQVASALVRAAQATRLLGAEVVITGIRPEIAQTLVSLGVDLAGLTTRNNLQLGIMYALSRG